MVLCSVESAVTETSTSAESLVTDTLTSTTVDLTATALTATSADTTTADATTTTSDAPPEITTFAIIAGSGPAANCNLKSDNLIGSVLYLGPGITLLAQHYNIDATTGQIKSVTVSLCATFQQQRHDQGLPLPMYQRQ
ncbi:hypothetical protein FNYG_12744 [Fusarium nygamai]|uniref:Uncharacterized protein n=1 Tax=Gibberella nygamai TaxID=42673 RepID=A0A2K0VV69_GIBNY|nr:hypothetical protein FNYG_12744 [Fusarium nygamai]